jgi:hypothetical protein
MKLEAVKTKTAKAASTAARRIMIVDSFGQRVQMSVDQFRKLAAEGVSDRFWTLANL